MERYFSVRRVPIVVLAILVVTGAFLDILKISGQSLAQAVGFDSVRGAAQPPHAEPGPSCSLRPTWQVRYRH